MFFREVREIFPAALAERHAFKLQALTRYGLASALPSVIDQLVARDRQQPRPCGWLLRLVSVPSEKGRSERLGGEITRDGDVDATLRIERKNDPNVSTVEGCECLFRRLSATEETVIAPACVIVHV